MGAPPGRARLRSYSCLSFRQPVAPRRKPHDGTPGQAERFAELRQSVAMQHDPQSEQVVHLARKTEGWRCCEARQRGCSGCSGTRA